MIAADDVKLRHLGQRPECSLVAFETIPPFRGVRVAGAPTLLVDDANVLRAAIAGRNLGAEHGRRFTEQRREPGVAVRLSAVRAHAWDLSAILPAG